MPLSFAAHEKAGTRGLAGPTPRFTHFDFITQGAGTVIDVRLSAVNEVRLMMAVNYEGFTEQRDLNVTGGVAKKSPVGSPCPRDALGIW